VYIVIFCHLFSIYLLIELKVREAGDQPDGSWFPVCSVFPGTWSWWPAWWGLVPCMFCVSRYVKLVTSLMGPGSLYVLCFQVREAGDQPDGSWFPVRSLCERVRSRSMARYGDCSVHVMWNKKSTWRGAARCGEGVICVRIAYFSVTWHITFKKIPYTFEKMDHRKQLDITRNLSHPILRWRELTVNILKYMYVLKGLLCGLVLWLAMGVFTTS